MPLSNLSVVLFRPKYPENIGSVARAMLNMGVKDLVLVDPADFDLAKAEPLATFHARHILEGARVLPTLREALAGTALCIGTTARTGGWRKGLLTPARAAQDDVLPRLAEGGRVALVFGPEDRGLTNAETSLCDRLVMIPAHPDCTSLNLSQAVLILLYECFQGSLAAPFEPKGPPGERDASFEEREALFTSLQGALSDIGYLKDQNQDYWMLPVRRFFGRFRLRRNEFNLLMGVCRQVRWVASQAGERKPAAGECQDKGVAPGVDFSCE